MTSKWIAIASMLLGLCATPAFAKAAKLGAWNSCTGNNSWGDICVEQWGSYPQMCTIGKKLKDQKNHPGKRCKKICNTDACSSGCYTKYQKIPSTVAMQSHFMCEKK
jgi:hypothetical protein